jgi:hypothetical protein
MGISFDDLNDRDDDLGAPPLANAALGLVVAEKAVSGEALLEEEKASRREYSHLVLFSDDDPDSGEEVLLNPAEFQVAMRLDHMPTLAEAESWIAAGRPRSRFAGSAGVGAGDSTGAKP